MHPLQLSAIKIITFFILQLGLTSIVQAQCTGAVTVLRFNNLNISLNQSSNQLSIFGLECDPCSYLTEKERTNCKCFNDCDRDYETCKEDCIENSTSIQQLTQCLNTCDLFDENCREGCGPEVEPIRTPVRYRVLMNFWWTTGLVETTDGPADESYLSPWELGSPPDPIIINLTDDLSDLEISYCYETNVIVEYDDGVCCFFFDTACLNRG